MSTRELSFGKQLTSVYLPTMIFETGMGAITPVVPLSAIHMHSGTAIAAIIIALMGIGQVVGDIPAGHIAARIGDRKAMLYGAAVSFVVLIICAFAANWILLAICVFILGAVNALFTLARQAYLVEVTSPLKRSRAMSTLGGMQRIGSLIGPFIGGAIMAGFATHGNDWLPGAYWLAVVLVLVTGAVVFAVPEIYIEGKPAVREVKASYLLRKNLRMFATLGIAFILVGCVRQASNTALPLWSEHIGLSASVTSYVYGFSGLLDAALFYPAGRVMDRMGRMWVAIPSMVVLGVSIFFIPFTHGIGTITVVAIIMGFGNSIGAGILMTIAADTAPAEHRAQYLALCRLFGDSGSAAGPLLVAGGAAIGLLAGGISLMGIFGVIAAGIFTVTLPKFTVHANRRTRLAHGLTERGAKLEP